MSIFLPEQGLESLSEREPDYIGLKRKTQSHTAPRKGDRAFSQLDNKENLNSLPWSYILKQH